MSLKDDLMDIPNVGEKRAEQIMRIIEDHDTGESETIEKALMYFDRGKPRIAESVLRDYSK